MYRKYKVFYYFYRIKGYLGKILKICVIYFCGFIVLFLLFNFLGSGRFNCYCICESSEF